jgi:3-oxoacyl-[acyl-carrier protein] reductase
VSAALPLADSRAVVTGSTSGIGRAVALELARAGANLVIHGRNLHRAKGVCDEIQQLKRQATPLVTDLAEPDAWEKLVDDAWRSAPVDIWVNNAGADVLTGETAHWTFDQKIARLWQVDVAGTIGLARAVGRRMCQRGRGAIVNIGWDQADTGMAGDSGEMFSATKGAIMAFTRSLAKSLAPNVRVNCVAPGWIRTAWGEEASDYWQRRVVRESLMRRWGEPEDIAQAVAFLASPAASFITGQILNVNGGRADGSEEDTHEWVQ